MGNNTFAGDSDGGVRVQSDSAHHHTASHAHGNSGAFALAHI